MISEEMLTPLTQLFNQLGDTNNSVLSINSKLIQIQERIEEIIEFLSQDESSILYNENLKKSPVFDPDNFKLIVESFKQYRKYLIILENALDAYFSNIQSMNGAILFVYKALRDFDIISDQFNEEKDKFKSEETPDWFKKIFNQES